MNTDNFRIRSYGVSELATLYNPSVLPGTAVKRLNIWIHRHCLNTKKTKETQRSQSVYR
jgi:hypothetical protein